MSRRRRLLLVRGAVALLGVAGFALLTWLSGPAPAPGVTLENFRRLQKGMSVRDVEALLGKPLQASGAFSNTWPTRSGTYSASLSWCSGNLMIVLEFKAGRVWNGRTLIDSSPGFANYRIGEYLRSDESLLNRIRRLLHF